MPPERQLGYLWGGVALLLVAVAPLGPSLAAGLPACPLKTVADVPCLTCGATRSALALVRFDPIAALKLNPLVTAGWIGLVLGGLVAGALAIVGRPLREPRGLASPVARFALVAALLANWAYVIWAGT